MNRPSNILVLLISLAVVFGGCEKNINLQVPTAPPQLVVNSIFTHDSVWTIEISTSATPGSAQAVQSLKDATLNLTDNGDPVEDFYLDSVLVTRSIQGIDRQFTIYQYKTRTSMPVQDHYYEIQVIHPDYAPVVAEGFLPTPVMVDKTNNTQSGDEIRTIGDREMRLYEFSIQSPSEGQYFGIEIISDPANGGGTKKLDFFSTDEVFSGNPGTDNPNGKTSHKSHTGGGEVTVDGGAIYDTSMGIFFSNESFSGQSRDFSIYVDSEYGGENGNLSLHILTLSTDLYHFATHTEGNQSGNVHSLSHGNEPFTNIDGGYGIFAGYSTSKLSLQ